MLLNLHLLQLGLSTGPFPSLLSKHFHHTSVKIKFIESWSKIVEILLLSDKNSTKCCGHFNIFKWIFKIVNLVIDNYGFKCKGANDLLLGEMTFLTCGDIEH